MNENEEKKKNLYVNLKWQTEANGTMPAHKTHGDGACAIHRESLNVSSSSSAVQIVELE